MEDFSIALSQEGKQILYGTLLGDGYLRKKEKVVRLSHSEKQLQYLLWKRSFFDEKMLRKLYRKVYPEGYVNYNFDVNLKDYKDFYEELKRLCYSHAGRKKISLSLLNRLGPLGLAVWWMDDGCLSIYKGNRYGKLCTHCFNFEEHILMKEFFRNRFGIDVQIKIEKRKYYFFRLGVESLKKLISIIYKYVLAVPSMVYKIDLKYQKSVKETDWFYSIYKEIHDSITVTTEERG